MDEILAEAGLIPLSARGTLAGARYNGFYALATTCCHLFSSSSIQILCETIRLTRGT